MVLTHAFRKALTIGDKKYKKSKKIRSQNVVFFQDQNLVFSSINQDSVVYVQGQNGISRSFRHIRLSNDPQIDISKMSTSHMPILNLSWKPDESIPFVLCPAGELHFSAENPLMLKQIEFTNIIINKFDDWKINFRKPFYMSQFPITEYIYDWVMSAYRWNRQELEEQKSEKSKYQNLEPKTSTSNQAPVLTYVDMFTFCNRLSKMLGFDEIYTIKMEEERPKRTGLDGYNGTDRTTITRNPNKKGIRLPTILEWLYAANANSNFKYAGSNNISDVGYDRPDNWEKLKDYPKLIVGQKKPNAWGIYDLSGFLEYSTEDTIDELYERFENYRLYNPSTPLVVLENLPTKYKKEFKETYKWNYGKAMSQFKKTSVGCPYRNLEQDSMWLVSEKLDTRIEPVFAGFFVVLDIF